MKAFDRVKWTVVHVQVLVLKRWWFRACSVARNGLVPALSPVTVVFQASHRTRKYRFGVILADIFRRRWEIVGRSWFR